MFHRLLITNLAALHHRTTLETTRVTERAEATARWTDSKSDNEAEDPLAALLSAIRNDDTDAVDNVLDERIMHGRALYNAVSFKP